MSDKDLTSKNKKPGFVRRLLHGVVRVLKTYFIMVGISATFAPILLVLMIQYFGNNLSTLSVFDSSSSKKDPTEVTVSKDPRYIEVSMEGFLTAQNDYSKIGFSQLFSTKKSISVQDMRALLRRAAKDEQVKALVLDMKSLSGGVYLHELKRLLDEFKLTKKPMFAFTNHISDSELYLLSNADSLAISPAAEIFLTGPVFSLTYFSQALNKLGVEFDVVKAGKYKSAMESFIADSPSEATLEMYRSMEKSEREHLIQSIANSRAIQTDLVAQWFKQGIYAAEQAKSAGIVHFIGTKAQFMDSLSEILGGLKKQKWDAYLKSSSKLDEDIVSRDSGSKLGFIYAQGEIHLEESSSDNYVITPESFAKEVNWAKEQEDIKAVVVRIDSPGGSATASEVMYQDLKTLAEKKPVIISMGNYAASGGYYMSVGAPKIFAEPRTLTGSIGVIGAMPRATGVKEKWGVSFYTLNDSDRKRFLDPSEKLSPEDKKALESTISQTYELFLSRVSEGRKMPIETIRTLAEGRVYTGLEALELGLVDDIGGLTEAFQAAKEAAQLDVNKLYSIEQYQDADLNILECLQNPFKKHCLDLIGTRMNTSNSSLTSDLDWVSYLHGANLDSKIQSILNMLGIKKQRKFFEMYTVWDGYWSLGRDF